MFAIIQAGGRQVKVQAGETVRLDRLQAEPGSAYENDQVLAVSKEDGAFVVGTPTVEGARVTGTVVDHRKDKKIIVFKRKRRKGYRKKQGHRQQRTLVKIESISA
ncbi:MAG: 50S ribosomal protein L21 [bacterium]|jgi:large subunit ribosomal protein L21